jgi:hypothetical protein
MSQSLVRFIIGGAIVSAFAIIGDVLRPKSFAGLFGASGCHAKHFRSLRLEFCDCVKRGGQ